jgi:hypothetical protein
MAQDGRPDRLERTQLQSAEERPEDTVVLADPRGSANYGYAYHERAGDGSPLCGPRNDDLEKMTIEEAQRREKVPCRMCERLKSS